MPPHALQIDVWRRIVSDTNFYAEIVHSGLFKYYCGIRPQYERSGPEWIANMPVITRTKDIESMLYINSIMIRWPYDGTPPSVGFSFGCQWDREHGAGIILKADAVIDVGGANCLYCT